ncbi:nucleoid-structuring protein H-NS [Roseivirga sp. E12]|uniref:nucleoid-structuring protein H-NS n=1 Tax=Roseivirga sp. E12 TaxID=2819237 RepID=UPI001ABD321C|nr:nucleoid-structuring protein H-NS [Roseivirga sp. E12]MBO3698589.1 nucleoid-structuring protein H-NS [Roseivirga sp. E12]
MKIKRTLLFNSLKGLAFVGAIILTTASCKSQKALADVAPETPEEVVVVETPEPEPEPEPVVKPKEPSAEERITSSLNSYFSGIANASSTSAANSSIQEALRMFGSSEAPVLIIFYAANGQEDFDEPTTISKYLNYLKDQGKNPHKVKELVMDAQGKVKELVLVKK